MTHEQATEQTILQKPTPVTINEKTYHVAPPTLATLIEVSGLVSTLPAIDINTDNVAGEVLRTAKHTKAITAILATLILGAQKVNTRKHRKAFKALQNELLYSVTPSELFTLTAELLATMQVTDFFALTTFLAEANITKPTLAKVETEATALGL